MTRWSLVRCQSNSDGSRSESFDPGLVIFTPGLENFPQKSLIFQFFDLWVKKISTSWVKKYSDQSQDGLLITTGQKYPRVSFGPVNLKTKSLEKYFEALDEPFKIAKVQSFSIFSSHLNWFLIYC